MKCPVKFQQRPQVGAHRRGKPRRSPRMKNRDGHTSDDLRQQEKVQERIDLAGDDADFRIIDPPDNDADHSNQCQNTGC